MQTSPKLLIAIKGTQVRKLAIGELVTRPRYEPFTRAALTLLDHGGRSADIAGIRQAVIGALAPATFDPRVLTATQLVDRRLLVSRPDEARLALAVDVAKLAEATQQIRRQALSVEHIYDH